MFPVTGQTLTNASGGTAVFLGTIDSRLRQAIPSWSNALTTHSRYMMSNIRDPGPVPPQGHADSFEHLFFENRSAAAVTATVQLRGSFVPQLWDPHTGLITSPVIPRQRYREPR